MRVVSGLLCALALSWGGVSNAVTFAWKKDCRNVTRINPAEPMLVTIFSSLVAKQPAIDWIFRKAEILHSLVPDVDPSKTTDVSHCFVEGEQDEQLGREPHYRRLSFQMQWDPYDTKVGVPTHRWEQHGMRFTYLDYPTKNNRREPIGYEVCRRPEGCPKIGFDAIQHPNSTKEVKAVSYGAPVRCALPRDSSGKEISKENYLRSIAGDLEAVRFPERRVRREVLGTDGRIYIVEDVEPGYTVDPLYQLATPVLTKKPNEAAFIYCHVSAPADEPATARELDRRFYFSKISQRLTPADGGDFTEIEFTSFRVDLHAQCDAPTFGKATNCPTTDVVGYAKCEGQELCANWGATLTDLGETPPPLR